MEFVLTPVTLILLAVVVVTAALAAISSRRKRRNGGLAGAARSTEVADAETASLRQAPGPSTIPLLGSMHHLSAYNDNPFAGFTALSEEYGDVYSLQMGATPAVVVNSFEGIKEVLIKKGNQYDGRPNIPRWNHYFGDDRSKSLALCDYTTTQKTRRALARAFLMARPESHNYESLSQAITLEMEKTLPIIESTESTPVDIKNIVGTSVMNMFCNYMCSTNFEYDDEEFKAVVNHFNAIFDDINEGHPTDFLPWLAPFYRSYTSKLKGQAESIRAWILKNIICDRSETIQNKEDVHDLADALLYNFKYQEEGVESLDFDNILFALEDLLGGSAALGNMTLRSMYYLATNPEAMKLVQKEVDEHVGNSRLPNINDRSEMPYFEAFMLEVLRKTSSPIVPHSATEDSSVGGFEVKKGTIVFLNNYKTNFSAEYWDQPEQFQPSRFIKNGQVKKPAHFLPFSTGKRACIGSRVYTNVVFVIVASLMQQFDVSLPAGSQFYMKPGSVALKSQDIIFTKRQ